MAHPTFINKLLKQTGVRRHVLDRLDEKFHPVLQMDMFLQADLVINVN